MLAPWKKSHDKPRQHSITSLTKACIVKAMVFPVVTYRYESWTIKKARCQRNDAFKSWCWRNLLRVPWTARRPNQSILKEISPEYSLEGLMLKLKLQYFGQLAQRANSWRRSWCWERLRAGGEGDNTGWSGWMASLTQYISLSKLQEMVKDREPWCAVVHGDTTEQLNHKQQSKWSSQKCGFLGASTKKFVWERLIGNYCFFRWKNFQKVIRQ